MLRLKQPNLTIKVAVLIAITTTTLLTAPSVDAYNLFGQGCRYDPANDDDGLGIGFNTRGSLYDSEEQLSIEHAASAWNDAMTPQFTVVSYGSSRRDLRVQWANLGSGVGGSLTRCGSSHYRRDPLFKLVRF